MHKYPYIKSFYEKRKTHESANKFHLRNEICSDYVDILFLKNEEAHLHS